MYIICIVTKQQPLSTKVLPWTVVYGGLYRDLISISNGGLALMGFPELTNQLIHT